MLNKGVASKERKWRSCLEPMIFLKSPNFWYSKPNILQKIVLGPIAGVYSYISTRNYWGRYRYKSEKSRVIAVGGLTLGGSGKTVVTKSICEFLKSKNKKVAVLSRGYGRSSVETLVVDNKIHSYKDVGDEPLLLSYSVPVYVGKDRSKSAKLAEQDGFEFLILDDGISQKYLQPDVKLLVIDQEQGFGNGEMFPLGPNRLDFEKIKADINGIILLGKEKTNLLNENIFFGRIQEDLSRICGKIIAFCGIGYPDKFFRSLQKFDLIRTVTFPDHYPFSENDIMKLITEADAQNAQLVTTEKDLMRIPLKYRNKILSIPVKIVWDDDISTFLSF